MSVVLYSNLFDDFADDLLEERSIRPLIIIGASKIDQLLQEILSSHLLPKIAKESDPDELLEGDRPLSTFSARIKLCYRLGLLRNGDGVISLEFDACLIARRDRLIVNRKD